jgi:sugar/nucleoside kinase (ribokinase family)
VGQPSSFGRTRTLGGQVDILVAGSIAIDLSCDFAPLASPNKTEVTPQFHTSNPSIISQNIGGVGLNVTTAAHLCGASTRLCSLVGDDLSGRTALEMLGHLGLQTSAVQVLGKGTGRRTAHYVAVNDTKKDLVLAMADMTILEDQSESFSSTWEPEIAQAKPKWLLIDANWDVETLRKWISSGKAVGADVAFEPVSAEKSARLFSNSTKGPLKVFPNHEIDIATPNAIELLAIHTAAREAGTLDRQDWWQIINNLGIHDNTRDRLVALTSPSLVDQGIPQQSIQLLPFFPCLLTKLGPQGVLLTWLLKPGDERLSSPDAARYVLSRSPDGGSEIGIGGVYMRLFPAAESVPEEDIVSVTGVGDTFSGIVIAGLTKEKSLEELVKVAQKGSIMTLQSREPVSPRLGELRKELEN